MLALDLPGARVLHPDMTAEELRRARQTLGHAWGKGRPVSCAELASALRLTSGDPGGQVRDMERGKKPVSGPVSVAIDLFLQGVMPPDGIPATPEG